MFFIKTISNYGNTDFATNRETRKYISFETVEAANIFASQEYSSEPKTHSDVKSFEVVPAVTFAINEVCIPVGLPNDRELSNSKLDKIISKIIAERITRDLDNPELITSATVDGQEIKSLYLDYNDELSKSLELERCEHIVLDNMWAYGNKKFNRSHNERLNKLFPLKFIREGIKFIASSIVSMEYYKLKELKTALKNALI